MDDQINIKAAVTNPYQIYMRDDLQDTGSIPSGARTASMSPDIIPRQRLLDDPNELITTDWDRDMGQPLVEGITNYIYVRGASRDNVGAGNEVVGRVNLYSVPSCLFMTPNRWTQIPEPGDDVTFTATGNDQHLLGSAPFRWTPPNRNVHYCLVAQVQTNAEPNNIPAGFPNNGAFINWVVDDPAIAWRNLSIEENRTGTVSQSQSFGNLDNYPVSVMFLVTAKGFENGTTITLGSQSPCLGAPINEERVVNNPNYSVVNMNTVAPRSDGVLDVFVTPPEGGNVPVGATLTIQYIQFGEAGGALSHDLQSDALLKRHSQPLSAYGLADEDGGQGLHGTRLGEVTIEYK
ncbi:hypothetical protein [Kordiimonas sp.]|uniref:hypothetical protein n=1 Tax=Kordiimonas sp. TaxID=1970157 RepID=UPI003A91E6A4